MLATLPRTANRTARVICPTRDGCTGVRVTQDGRESYLWLIEAPCRHGRLFLVEDATEGVQLARVLVGRPGAMSERSDLAALVQSLIRAGKLD